MPLCTESRWTTSAEQTDPRNGRLKRRDLTHRHARGLDEASPPLSRAEKECHACVTLLSCLSKHPVASYLSLHLSLRRAPFAETQIDGVGVEMCVCG